MMRFLPLAAAMLTAACLFDPLPSLGADSQGKAAPKAKPYPLDVCLVSGEKLGGMGEAYVFTVDGREVKLCCEDCKKGFEKNQAKHLAKIDEAAKSVKAYPLDTCLVSGEKLGDDACALVHKSQEVRFCCKGCAKDFQKEPETFLKKLAAAKK